MKQFNLNNTPLGNLSVVFYNEGEVSNAPQDALMDMARGQQILFNGRVSNCSIYQTEINNLKTKHNVMEMNVKIVKKQLLKG